jgi:hypothetical protein
MGITDKLLARIRGRTTPKDPEGVTTDRVVDTSDVQSELPEHPYFGGAHEYYEKQMKMVHTRKELYALYDEMDQECPEFSSAMDVYADNATRGESEDRPSVQLVCDDARALKVMTETRDRLDMEEILWPMARDIAKYGERAEEVVADDKMRVVRLKPLPTERIVPNMDKYGRLDNPAYQQMSDTGKVLAEFQEWQMLYLANLKSRGHRFGTSFGYAAAKPFKQLRLMEEAMVVGRLTRANNRLLYKIDTTGLVGPEAEAHVEKVRVNRKKRRTVSRSGRMDLDHNPLSVEEDIYIATTKESGADVKTLQGDFNVGQLRDIEYTQQKIFTALKVPKAYLTQEENTRARAVMSSQDIQFARSVRRLQKLIVGGLRQVFDLALLLDGMDPKKVKYEVRLPVISIIDELRHWQTEQLKMLVAQMMKQTFWPDDAWIFRDLMGYDEETTKALVSGQVKPDQYNGLYQAPKVGSTKNYEAVLKLLHKMSPEEQELLAEHMSSLDMLVRWEAEREHA